MRNRLWNREELILAVNLYCKTPFGKLHKSNPDVISLAKYINRTPSSVAWKLVNFASLDESLKNRGIKGAEHSSKLDKEIWEEFYNNWDELAYESEKLLVVKKDEDLELQALSEKEDILVEGKYKERLIKTRVNQAFFRKTILASYNEHCCITGINNTNLLIASHIRPWAIDEKNRMNPRNGLCLNSLHDRAFENGLLTVTPNYKIKISKKLKTANEDRWIYEYFIKYDNKEIILPTRFLPDPDLLEYHYYERFKG